MLNMSSKTYYKHVSVNACISQTFNICYFFIHVIHILLILNSCVIFTYVLHYFNTWNVRVNKNLATCILCMYVNV